jgi:phosphatidylserine/phosphatidylglycerophosphate/cardiolipin synthase-like enzyme
LGADPLATISAWFNRDVWPWPTKPHAYVERRLVSGSPERCYQHAKVVIADATTPNAKALVTSANFSETAQRHNVEAGWLADDVNIKGSGDQAPVHAVRGPGPFFAPGH